MSYLFGFIGTGNMGGALAKAASKSTKNILLSNKPVEKAKALAEKINCTAGTNEDVAANCKYIFLGVKPQMMDELLKSIANVLKNRTDEFVLVTMAAGLSTDTIKKMAGGNYKVIRIMPNTPVEVGLGEILYTKTKSTTYEELKVFLDNMKAAGDLTEIPENLMDAGCSVSGCGPAFVYMFIKGIAKGGIECGIDENTALKLASQTVIGSAKLFMESNKNPDVLIQNVCSPGGSTIEGVKSLETDNLEGIVAKAINSSYKRNIELGKS